MILSYTLQLTAEEILAREDDFHPAAGQKNRIILKGDAMMRTIIEQNVLLYVMAAVGMLGILSQVLLNRCYRLLIREASDVQMEKKEFMKKLKLRFQTDRKRSGDRMNMTVFLQKNLMDYRYRKLSLHQWKRLGAGLFLVSIALGAGGVIYSLQTGIEQVHIRHIYEMTAVITAVSAAAALWLDEPYKRSCLLTVLEDYFCHSGAAVDYQEVSLETAATEKTWKKAPSIVGIRKKSDGEKADTRAQKEKRELQENLARINAGAREAAAELEQSRERKREILRQMDPKEQERIIREVLAEFLA